MSDAPRPRVRLSTDAGIVVLELRSDAAPNTSANFLRYVDAHLYDGGTFYRAVRPESDPVAPPIGIVQGGPAPDRERYPPVAHESTRITGLSHLDGTVTMARRAVDTADAEFAICVGDHRCLDYGGTRAPDGQGFAAFGHVVAGMEVIIAIHRTATGAADPERDPHGQRLGRPVVILECRRAR